MLKKFPNRRLYDTKKGVGDNRRKVAGCYVTVAEVRDRLVAGESVSMHNTGENITTDVLLGVVSDDLKNGRGPTAAQLRMFIRTYSEPFGAAGPLMRSSSASQAGSK